MRSSFSLAVLFAALLVAADASPKPKKLKGEPRTLTELEAKVSELEKSKDVRVDYDALTAWLGLGLACSDACDSLVSAKWLTANLDTDADDEKVLTIATRGSGACATTSLEVFVFDKVGADYAAVGYTQLATAGAKVAEVTLAAVHSSAMKDLVVHVDGHCGSSAAEQIVRVFTLETGRLEELAASDDVVGKGLTGHSFTGAPAVIELSTAKGKTKLSYDPAHGYDSFTSYEQAKKSTVSGSEDLSLGPTECGAPMGTELVTECRLGGSAKLEVMVQNGKALGMTVTTTPVDRAFGRCARKKLAAATWKSLPAASGCTRTFTVK